MSEKQVSEPEMTDDEMMSMRFAQMVIQQSNMAMMLMGKMPHPHTGKTEQDIEAARMFIDQLEMVAVKTKGNLSREEEQLLKQSLMALRMAFVESVVSSPAKAPDAAPPSQIPPSPAPEAAESDPAPDADAPADDPSRKKFTKKY